MHRYGGLNVARLDIGYMTGETGKQNPMDLCTESGMAFLVCKAIIIVCFDYMVMVLVSIASIDMRSCVKYRLDR